MLTSKDNTHRKRGKVKNEITRSISALDPISCIVLDVTCLCSLPQIILVHTNTMKVALNPKPMTVVTKLVPEPPIIYIYIYIQPPTSQNQSPTHKTTANPRS